jgi:shikimate kinase
MTENFFTKFTNWLNPILESNTFDSVLAFCFNLYEGACEESEPGEWHVQIIGSAEFDLNNEDWACPPEVFTSGDDLLIISKDEAGQEWYEALEKSIQIITQYLETGKHRNLLLSKKAVSVGFVNGNLYHVWLDGILHKDIEVWRG